METPSPSGKSLKLVRLLLSAAFVEIVDDEVELRHQPPPATSTPRTRRLNPEARTPREKGRSRAELNASKMSALGLDLSLGSLHNSSAHSRRSSRPPPPPRHCGLCEETVARPQLRNHVALHLSVAVWSCCWCSYASRRWCGWTMRRHCQRRHPESLRLAPNFPAFLDRRPELDAAVRRLLLRAFTDP